ncbi:hypothetical protein KP509_19G077100 [Ceratopteris richardii]|uniref:Uncharacterized protein n=1 Tax=Ceratopteris richardii TaxID=49495 RepID=A0A8T2SNT8_CERRI|nr:hypothetical protein KP509_19G077100 [Ceratopteris richardii]
MFLANLSPPPAIARSYQHNCHANFILRLRSQTLSGNDGVGGNEPPKQPSVMSAFERAAAYRKSLGKDDNPSADGNVKDGETSASSSSDLQSKTRVPIPSAEPENRLQQGFKGLNRKQECEMESALAAQEESRRGGGEKTDGPSQDVEVEIITKDGIIKRKMKKPGEYVGKIKGPQRTGINSTDFMGLDFSEKKGAGKGARPAGLAAGFESPPPGPLPEVEIITRDGKAQRESRDSLYRPKVATWGIFERPADISRTYGGGRIIKPGEQLETEEEKQAREARTKALLAAYYKKAGLDIDPKIKAECTELLKHGTEMFERGYIQDAIQQFEEVMQRLPYQNELHGLAALQKALCLDSSNRFKEAKELYEKIASHPNVNVRKKAKQLLFGFQAMDNLNVSLGSQWDTSAYLKYFSAFSDGYNTGYKASKEELDEGRMTRETIVYVALILFPLLLLFLVFNLKRS